SFTRTTREPRRPRPGRPCGARWLTRVRRPEPRLAMGFLGWFTRNWAETGRPGDPDLAAPEIPLSVPEALTRVRSAVAGLPLWRVESADPENGTLAATRRTRLWHFVDDITIRLEPMPGGTRVHARSASRVGK